MANKIENGCLNTYLFDPKILKQLDPKKFTADYKNGVTPQRPGEHLVVRPLRVEDFDKGYLDLLKQLTVVGDVSREKFIAQFNKMKCCKDTYYVVVVEDCKIGQIVGSATLVVEQKFIHHTSSRGRIEDVIVSDLYRGKQLGKVLVDLLVLLSQERGCYKVSLECKDQNIQFYAQFGFKNTPGQNFMQQRFFD